MEGSINHDVLTAYLRSAKPRLVYRAYIDSDPVKITAFVGDGDDGWDEILAEGYDAKYSPLGCPVYWRIVKQGAEEFYCSTFQVPRHQVFKAWGEKGLAHCDPVTGMAVARIETYGSAPTRGISDDVRIAAAARASRS
jgi:hypothetical protein